MGTDKALIEWEGSAWSTRTARLLDRLFCETLLVGGHPEADAPGRRVEDDVGPACALRGVVSALEAATSERVLVVATDMPMLGSEILLALTAWPEADAVVPVDDEGDQPLCAIYRREVCLASARDRLGAEELALGPWLDSFETARVPLARFGLGDRAAAMLTNVNTPDQRAFLEGC
jgi:molybdopterin-guanine dinucleotide biosynthesis protein A